MALTSKISEYDTRWPDMFNSEKAHLEGVFGTSRHANLLIYNRYWFDSRWHVAHGESRSWHLGVNRARPLIEFSDVVIHFYALKWQFALKTYICNRNRF